MFSFTPALCSKPNESTFNSIFCCKISNLFARFINLWAYSLKVADWCALTVWTFYNKVIVRLVCPRNLRQDTIYAVRDTAFAMQENCSRLCYGNLTDSACRRDSQFQTHQSIYLFSRDFDQRNTLFAVRQ